MVMRALYHFPTSPFSRRVRLALAHKGLEVDLKDARANPAFHEEARAKHPLKTVPLLVEPDGRAMGDSTSIAHYLDGAYPGPRLWPAEHLVYDVTSLVDVILNTLVDTGTRYYALRDHDAWPTVKGEMMGRVQRALDGLAQRCDRPTIASSGWSAADMWLFTMTAWLEGLPGRAPSFPLVAQIVSLGWTLPPALSRWADAHRARGDVGAL
jgi:glutathione S-transferase